MLMSVYSEPRLSRRIFLAFYVVAVASFTQYAFVAYAVIFVAGLIQLRAFTERRGVWVDVWIDDMPEYVCRDHEALADPGLRWLNEDDFNSGVCKDVKK